MLPRQRRLGEIVLFFTLALVDTRGYEMPFNEAEIRKGSVENEFERIG